MGEQSSSDVKGKSIRTKGRGSKKLPTVANIFASFLLCLLLEVSWYFVIRARLNETRTTTSLSVLQSSSIDHRSSSNLFHSHRRSLLSIQPSRLNILFSAGSSCLTTRFVQLHPQFIGSSQLSCPQSFSFFLLLLLRFCSRSSLNCKFLGNKLC